MLDKFSDEQISAYLDNELSLEERVAFETAMSADSDLRRAVDELRALRSDLQALPRHILPGDFAQKVLDMAERAVLTGRQGEAGDAAPRYAPGENSRRPPSAAGGGAGGGFSWKTLFCSATAAAVAVLFTNYYHLRNRTGGPSVAAVEPDTAPPAPAAGAQEKPEKRFPEKRLPESEFLKRRTEELRGAAEKSAGIAEHQDAAKFPDAIDRHSGGKQAPAGIEKEEGVRDVARAQLAKKDSAAVNSAAVDSAAQTQFYAQASAEGPIQVIMLDVTPEAYARGDFDQLLTANSIVLSDEEPPSDAGSAAQSGLGAERRLEAKAQPTDRMNRLVSLGADAVSVEATPQQLAQLLNDIGQKAQFQNVSEFTLPASAPAYGGIGGLAEGPAAARIAAAEDGVNGALEPFPPAPAAVEVPAPADVAADVPEEPAGQSKAAGAAKAEQSVADKGSSPAAPLDSVADAPPAPAENRPDGQKGPDRKKGELEPATGAVAAGRSRSRSIMGQRQQSDLHDGPSDVELPPEGAAEPGSAQEESENRRSLAKSTRGGPAHSGAAEPSTAENPVASKAPRPEPRAAEMPRAGRFVEERATESGERQTFGDPGQIAIRGEGGAGANNATLPANEPGNQASYARRLPAANHRQIYAGAAAPVYPKGADAAQLRPSSRPRSPSETGQAARQPSFGAAQVEANAEQTLGDGASQRVRAVFLFRVAPAPDAARQLADATPESPPVPAPPAPAPAPEAPAPAPAAVEP